MFSVKKVMYIYGFVAFLIALAAPVSALAKLPLMASIGPQKFFVQKVGGDLVSVGVMVPPGASPHDYEPKPSQMAALAKAKAYFAIGVEFEKAWLPRFLAANPKLLVVHTEAEAPRMAMKGRHDHDQPKPGEHHHDQHAEEPKAEKHEHGHEAGEHHHHHAHGAPDPHIWLSPRLVGIQAKAIRDALVKLDPAHAGEYDRNLAGFKGELKELDRELRRAFAGLGKKRDILVFHPAWGYLCRSYGLNQVAVEKEGKAPTAKGLAKLIGQAREAGAKVIFVQPQFSSQSARAVAKAIGGKVVPLNPLAEDWAENLRAIARELKKAAY